MSALIRRLSQASDQYGAPYLLGFMAEAGVTGLRECYSDPVKYAALAQDYMARYLEERA